MITAPSAVRAPSAAKPQARANVTENGAASNAPSPQTKAATAVAEVRASTAGDASSSSSTPVFSADRSSEITPSG